MINTALRAFGRARIVHPGVCARVIRAVRRLLRVPDREFVESFFGLSYPGHTGVYLDSFVFYMGGYEIGALNLFADLLEVSRGLAREAGDLGGFLARFPEGYQAYVANVFGAWTAGSYNRL